MRYLIGMLILGFIFTVPAFAQNDNYLQSVVDYKVNKMKKDLQMTQEQAIAVRPIIFSYLTKRNALLQGAEGQGIVDHVAIKTTLKQLQGDENKQLSKILTLKQMEKWINKQNLMAAMNPDGAESTVDEQSVTMSPEGANFKF